MEPIGVVRSPFTERVAAPRQATVAGGRRRCADGSSFFPAVDTTTHSTGWRAGNSYGASSSFIGTANRGGAGSRRCSRRGATPSRASSATRSPHRPNPIGLTATRIERVDGLVVHVRGIDVLDGSPVLDLKPYVAYADAHPEAGSGWLGAPDPVSAWQVTFADAAREALVWLNARGIDLAPPIESSLALGPQPHPYPPHSRQSRRAVRAVR